MSDIFQWLETWAAQIRAVDYGSARQLFADNVISFGSYAEQLTGLDDLERRQWRNIWGNTRGFHFVDPVIITQSPEAATIASRWASEGKTPEGGWYPRSGRCTLVLVSTADGWRCTHSHFSMDPGIPASRLHDRAVGQ